MTRNPDLSMVSPVASLAPGVIGFLGITYVLNVFPPETAAICVISDVCAVTEYYACIITCYDHILHNALKE